MNRPQPAGAALRSYGLPRDLRLCHSLDFRAIYQQRLSVADGTLVVYGRANQRANGRLGLSVSRKVGKAHQRNRWKRLIREAYRHQLAAAQGLDLIVIPRQGITPNAGQINESLRQLLLRLQRKCLPRVPRS